MRHLTEQVCVIIISILATIGSQSLLGQAQAPPPQPPKEGQQPEQKFPPTPCTKGTVCLDPRWMAPAVEHNTTSPCVLGINEFGFVEFANEQDLAVYFDYWFAEDLRLGFRSMTLATTAVNNLIGSYVSQVDSANLTGNRFRNAYRNRILVSGLVPAFTLGQGRTLGTQIVPITVGTQTASVPFNVPTTSFTFAFTWDAKETLKSFVSTDAATLSFFKEKGALLKQIDDIRQQLAKNVLESYAARRVGQTQLRDSLIQAFREPLKREQYLMQAEDARAAILKANAALDTYTIGAASKAVTDYCACRAQ